MVNWVPTAGMLPDGTAHHGCYDIISRAPILITQWENPPTPHCQHAFQYQPNYVFVGNLDSIIAVRNIRCYTGTRVADEQLTILKTYIGQKFYTLRRF
jgi:hypothetical protein